MGLRSYVKSIRERDPAVHYDIEVVLLYSGADAVFNHRIAHFFYKIKFFFMARLISQWSRFVTGIEIHPGANIGKNLFIDHGSGVIIGETTVIGDNCTIYQGVTLGGTGKDTGKRHPTLGNNVNVGSGAKVLGPIKIGDNARVAANSVVLREVPENSTVVGIPGRVVRINGEKTDHIHTPDPIAMELQSLRERIETLEKRLEEK